VDLKLERLLDLQEPAAAGRPTYLSAASGLVRLGAHLYVVADDEHHLGVFPVATHTPGVLLRLLAGDLPAKPRARKKAKPDLEALVYLPVFERYPHGALFALGSGSKAQRRTGVLLRLNAQFEIEDAPRLIDLGPLHAMLADEFEDLNIEGAVIVGDSMRLLQRGNKGHRVNAVIEVELAAILTTLAHEDALDAIPLRRIQRYDLGECAGVPLGFTDAAALSSGELIFTAVAENTEDSYLDGSCVGAALGLLDREGQMIRLDALATAHKLEGLAAWSTPQGVQFLAVSDADDETVPAQLWSGLFAR
jgi:hypothetical protein